VGLVGDGVQNPQAHVAHPLQGVQETSVGVATGNDGGHGQGAEQQLLYGTTLVPKFWHEIRDSPDPTQYSIIQDVHRIDAASGAPHGLSRRRRSVLVFSAIYHFRYPNSVVCSNSNGASDVIGLGLDLGLSLGTAFPDTADRSFAQSHLGGMGLASLQEQGQCQAEDKMGAAETMLASSSTATPTPPIPSFDQAMEGILDVNIDDLIFSDDFMMSTANATATQNVTADAVTSPTQFFTEDFASYFPQ